MSTRGQQASLAAFAKRLRKYRREAGVRQADIFDKPSSVSRVENGEIGLSAKWVERYEAALDRDDLMSEFLAIEEAPSTRTYEPLATDDDIESRTRLIGSRASIVVGRTVQIRDRRRITPLNPPLAGARLRSVVPPVHGRQPKLLHRRAVGAEVIGHFWIHDELLLVDVRFTPPLTVIAPPFDFDMIYVFDVMASFFTEVPVRTPSEYFEVALTLPSGDYEVVSCEGLPDDIVVLEARAFYEGRPHRLTVVPLMTGNTAEAKYRNLRSGLRYGLFWRETSATADL